MAFTFRAAERARRFDPGRTLARRDDADLPFLGAEAAAGNGLLLDTCVYIDQMQGRAPPTVQDCLDIRIVHHSMVAVQELMHTVGILDPDDPRSARAVAAIERVVDAMPPHRLLLPDAETLASAAVHAGILCRRQGYGKDGRFRAFNNCVLFLQARKLGLTLLTRNVGDIDILLQMRPDGRALFYRT
ncbi:type II toxin-antitoxin system VapC family toxin [Methylobacterium sp. J-076]|uniref:type II toxin-antitoxin system VapC family toxin n=1 Tax=Methylobacterium sp. J-076 TaxID=2836655 RepID=UPI001FB9F9AD|nr:DNA-binding protein [Methylobacterium sp. J-076]MCJ2011448.1 DNA-binding protein [Methylobacterium sp. J-076]